MLSLQNIRGSQRKLLSAWLLRVCIGRPKFSCESIHLLQDLVRSLGFLLVNLADRETDVNHHVVADRSLGDEIETDLPDGSAELDTPGAGKTQVFRANDFSRDGEAHGVAPLSATFSDGRFVYRLCADFGQ